MTQMTGIVEENENGDCFIVCTSDEGFNFNLEEGVFHIEGNQCIFIFFSEHQNCIRSSN